MPSSAQQIACLSHRCLVYVAIWENRFIGETDFLWLNPVFPGEEQRRPYGKCYDLIKIGLYFVAQNSSAFLDWSFRVIVILNV